MKHISDLFARYQNTIIAPQGSVVKEFIAVCKDEFGYTIKTEHCSYTVATKTMYITAPSVLKSELTRQKKTLLTVLKQRLGKNAPVEII